MNLWMNGKNSMKRNGLKQNEYRDLYVQSDT